MYPDWKERDRLDMFGKEIFLVSEKYYGYRLEPGKIMSGTMDQKYNTDIQKDIIERLEKMNVSGYKDFNRIYSDFDLDSPVFKFIFYTECMSNPKLDEQYKEKIEKLVMPSIYLPKEYFTRAFHKVYICPSGACSSRRAPLAERPATQGAATEHHRRVRQCISCAPRLYRGIPRYRLCVWAGAVAFPVG